MREPRKKTLTLHCNYFKCAWLVFVSSFFFWPCKHDMTVPWRYYGIHICSCTFILESKECCYTLCALFFRFTFFFLFIFAKRFHCALCAQFRFRTIRAFFFAINGSDGKFRAWENKKKGKWNVCETNSTRWETWDLGSVLIHAFCLDFSHSSYIIYVTWYIWLGAIIVVSLWLSIWQRNLKNFFFF